MIAFPFIILISAFDLFLAENSMDQDVYGGYSKQQIESLTTEGEGEFQPPWYFFTIVSEKESRKKFIGLQRRT